MWKQKNIILEVVAKTMTTDFLKMQMKISAAVLILQNVYTVQCVGLQDIFDLPSFHKKDKKIFFFSTAGL